jgi:hypothetical protein
MAMRAFGLARSDWFDDRRTGGVMNRADGKITDRLAVYVLGRLAIRVDGEQRHPPSLGALAEIMPGVSRTRFKIR